MTPAHETLRAALALLEHGFPDYAEAILSTASGQVTAAPRLRLGQGDTLGAIRAIRDALDAAP